MSNKIDETAWSDNDEIENEENYGRKKRCAFCHELLQQSASIVDHENSCKIAKKCNASRVLCKSGIKKFVCDICYSTFEFLKSLVEHEKRHDPPGGYFCNYCDERFCTDCEKQKHTENTHKMYKCRLCKKLLETSESYIEHIKIDHNGKQTEWIPCKKCHRMLSSEKILQRHLDSNCGVHKQFQCDLCHKFFTTKGILKTHMLIHSDNKEFVCPYCGKGFHNKYQLKSHEISHTGEKPWKCNVCCAEFAWKQSLVTHSTLHTGVKPYICESCGSRFSCTSNIIAHRKKRPDTCGLPQYCTKLTQATPRPSIYNPEMLTTDLPIKVKKNLQVVKEADKKKFKVKSKNERQPLENNNQIQKRTRKRIQKLTQKDVNPSDKEVKEEIQCNELKETNNFEDKTLNKHDYEMVKDVESEVLQPVFVANEVLNGTKLIADVPEIKSESIKFEELPEESKITMENIEITQKSEIIEANCPTLDDNLFIKDEIHIKEELQNDDDESIIIDSHNDEVENYYSSDQNKDSLPDFDTDIDSEYDPKKDFVQSRKTSNAIGKNLASNKDVKTNKINSKKKRQKEYYPVFRRRSKRLNGSIECEEIKQIKKRGRRKVLKDSRPIPLRKKTDLIKCPFCDSAVYRKYSLKKHLKRNHHKSDEEINFMLANIEEKGPRLDCDICKKKFTGKLSFEKHCKLHGDDRSLTIPCHDCYGQRFFRNRDELKLHVRNEHNDLICKECDKTFKLKSSFKEHVLRIHKNKPNPPEPTITCIKCGKLVKKCLLRDHERSNCGQEYLYECKICSKKFSTAGILKEHTKIHTGQLTAFCKFCSKGFRNKYQCSQHEMVHTGEKPFKCTYEGCTAAFAHRNNMINHYSLHTGLRRYMCSGCTERFSCISSLKAHWRTHADSCASHPENTTKAQFKVSLKKGEIIQC